MATPVETSPYAEFNAMMAAPAPSFMRPDVPFEYAPAQELGVDYTAPAANKEEEHSAFTRSMLRSVDETQALAAAGVGALGDAIGWDFLRDLGWDEYQAQMEEASKYRVDVGSIENINDVGTFLTWVAETAGGLVPSMAVSLATGGIGGAIGGALGKATIKNLGEKALRELVKPSVKRAIANQISKNVASGMAGAAAKKAAMADFVASLAQKGAMAGVVGSSSLLETGGNWADDATQHGLYNTSAGQDIAFGVLSGLSEVVGGEGSLIKKFLGRPVASSIAKVADDSLKKQFIKGIASGMMQEGTQEWVQETLSIVNGALQDSRATFTPDDLSRMVNAFAAGAVGGSLMSIPGTMRERFQAGKMMEEEAAKANRKNVPTLEQAEEYTAAADSMSSQYENVVKPQLNAESKAVLDSLEQEKADIYFAMAQAKAGGDVEAANEFQNALRNVAAKIAKEKKKAKAKETSYESSLEKARNYAGKQVENALKSDLDETVGRPKYVRKHTDTPFGELHKQTVTMIEQFANKQLAAHEVRLADMHKRLAEAERVSVLEGKDVYEVAQKNAESMRDALDKEQTYINKVLDTAEKAVRMVQYEGVDGIRTKATVDSLYAMDRSRDVISSAIAREEQQNEVARSVNRKKLEQDKRADLRNERADERAIKSLYFNDLIEERDRLYREDAVSKQEESRRLGDQLRYEDDMRRAVEEEQLEREFADNIEFTLAGGDRFLRGRPEVSRPLEMATPSKALSEQEREFFNRADMESFPNVLQDDFLSSFQRAVPAEEVQTPSLITPVQKTEPVARKVEQHKPIIERRAVGFKSEAPVNHVARVSGYISRTLDKLPVLKEQVTVVRNVEDERIVGEIKAQLGKDWKAAYDTKTGKIYIFAENITDKADAVRAVLHEGVGHLGLRSILSQAELKSLLNLIYGSYAGTKKFNIVANTKDYESLTELQQAEEYIARLAERARIGTALKENEKTIWKKIKSFFKSLLTKLGIIKITDKDITNIITASIHYLANESNVGKKPNLISDQEVLRVRASAPYRAWIGKAKDYAGDAREYVDDWKITKKSLDDTGSLKKHTKGEQLLETFADRMRRVQVTQRAITERGGNIDSKSDVYTIEELSHNKISEMIGKYREEFIEGPNGIANLVAKVISTGVSRDEAFNRASRLAYAVHAFERNLRIEERSNGANKNGSGLTYDQVFKIIEEIGVPVKNKAAFRDAVTSGKITPDNIITYITPEYAAVIKRMQDVSNYRIDMMVKSGTLHPGIAANWKKAYNYYMPLNEWKKEQLLIEPNYKIVAGVKTVNMGKWDPIKWATGTTKQVENPVLNALLQTEDTIKNVGRVETGRALLKLVEDNKELASDIFEVENESSRRTYVDRLDNGDLAIRRMKAKFNQNVSESELVTVIDDKGNHVRIWVKDPALARTLRGENVQRAHKLIKSLGAATRFLSVVNTTYSPDFLLSNPIRDVGSALLNITEAAGVDPKFKLDHRELMKKVLQDWSVSRKTIWNVLRGKSANAEWNNWFEEYKTNGAYTQMYGQHDFDSLHKELESRVKAASSDGVIAGTMKYVDIAKEWVTALSNSLENSVRLSVFKNFAEGYMLKGMAKEDALQKAASVALNITVNFTRKGGASPILSSLYAFANASIQANLRLLRTIFSDKKRAVKMIGAFTGGTMLMAALNREIGGDDDDGVSHYDKIPSWVKNGNLIFMSPVGDGSYIKIPLPYGFHLFNVLGHAFDGAITGHVNPMESGVDLLKAMFGNFSPIGEMEEGWTMFVPTALRPFAQIQTNTNFFGQPIRPEQQFYHKGEFPDSQKYWSGCNSLAVKIATGLNLATFGSEARAGLIDISPETLEHLWDSYMGGFGKTIARTFDLAVKSATGDEITSNDFPVIRRFVGEDNYFQTLPFYSKVKMEIETQVNEYDTAKDSGKLNPDVVKKTLKGRALSNALKDAQQQLKKISKLEKDVKQLSPSDAIARKRQLRERRDEVMKRLIKQANTKGLL